MTWHAEHPGWDTHLQEPLTDDSWQLMMVHHYDEDARDRSWYTRYELVDSLVDYIGTPEALFGGVHAINGILLDMQREIGRLHSGASTE